MEREESVSVLLSNKILFPLFLLPQLTTHMLIIALPHHIPSLFLLLLLLLFFLLLLFLPPTQQRRLPSNSTHNCSPTLLPLSFLKKTAHISRRDVHSCSKNPNATILLAVIKSFSRDSTFAGTKKNPLTLAATRKASRELETLLAHFPNCHEGE